VTDREYETRLLLDTCHIGERQATYFLFLFIWSVMCALITFI
jgi:hypothetical protein